MTAPKIPVAGQKFGRLTAIEATTGLKWRFRCDCGVEIERVRATVMGGNTKSCGCHKHDSLVAKNTTHGLSSHPLYQRWAGMIQRCTNINHVGWPNYGGRGIKVCDRWLNFENFLADMGECPSDEHSIERDDSNGNYEPGNCKWATADEQSRNTSRNVIVTVDGKSMTVRDWEIEKGVNRGAFQRRVDLGWPLEKAVTEPIQPGKALERRA